MAGSDPQRSLTTVEVTGPLTRDEVVWWHAAFAAGLAESRGLRIDLAKSGPWDLAGVQLLCAAIASGKRTGWPVVLANSPGVLTAIAERAALRDHLAGSVGE